MSSRRSRSRPPEESFDRRDRLLAMPVLVHRMVEAVGLVDRQHPGRGRARQAATQSVPEVVESVVGRFEDEIDGEGHASDLAEPPTGRVPYPDAVERAPHAASPPLLVTRAFGG